MPNEGWVSPGNAHRSLKKKKNKAAQWHPKKTHNYFRQVLALSSHPKQPCFASPPLPSPRVVRSPLFTLFASPAWVRPRCYASVVRKRRSTAALTGGAQQPMACGERQAGSQWGGAPAPGEAGRGRAGPGGREGSRGMAAGGGGPPRG